MPKKSIIGGEVFLKKRTGAHGAMAELLSKSNETQIKDREASSAQLRRPAPAKKPEINKNGAVSNQRVQRAVAPAHINAQAKQEFPAANMRRNSACAQRASAPSHARNSVSPEAKIAAANKQRVKKSIPKIRIPVKAMVCAVSAVAIIGIAAVVASIAKSQRNMKTAICRI